MNYQQLTAADRGAIEALLNKTVIPKGSSEEAVH